MRVAGLQGEAQHGWLSLCSHSQHAHSPGLQSRGSARVCAGNLLHSGGNTLLAALMSHSLAALCPLRLRAHSTQPPERLTSAPSLQANTCHAQAASLWALPALPASGGASFRRSKCPSSQQTAARSLRPGSPYLQLASSNAGQAGHQEEAGCAASPISSCHQHMLNLTCAAECCRHGRPGCRQACAREGPLCDGREGL